jgi:hypothetical protein
MTTHRIQDQSRLKRTICTLEQAYRILNVGRHNQVGLFRLGDFEEFSRDGMLMLLATPSV